jgi:hypothetical protein
MRVKIKLRKIWHMYKDHRNVMSRHVISNNMSEYQKHVIRAFGVPK